MAKLQLLDNEEIPTRKIFVGAKKPAPGSHSMDLNRYKYNSFRKYGEYSSMYIHHINNSIFIAINYKHSASVTALLAKGNQNINGILFEPKAIYSSFPPKIDDMEKWSTCLDTCEKTTGRKKANTDHTGPAPDHHLSSNIMNILDDDCVMEIFERVPLRDLCAIASTCTRFNENAKKVFATRFTNIDVVWLKDDLLPNVPIPMVLIASLFRNFGMHMKTVAINLKDIGEKRNDRVLSLILKYCTTENCALSGLKISNFQFHLNLMDEFRPIFGRLTHLSTSETDAVDLKRLLSMCKNVTHLQLEAVDFGRTHKQMFKQLEDIELICVKRLKNEKLKELISMNQQIKRLVICDPFGQLSSVAYQSISNLSMLEHIEVEPAIRMTEKDSEQNVLALAQLKHLKVVRLNCLTTPMNELLNSFAEKNSTIHDLSLKGLNLDSKNTRSISKMADIRTLRILDTRGPDTQSHFLKMVKKMPHLQHLVYSGSSQLSAKDLMELVEKLPDLSKLCLINQKDMVIDLDDYNKMLGWIQQRSNSIGLHIKMLGMELNMFVPEHIVERNHQWLNVNITNIDMEAEREHTDDEEEEEEEEDEEDANINIALEMMMMYHIFVYNVQRLVNEID